MSEEITVSIRNIDLGSIVKKIDSKAEFGTVNWEGHIDATLKGIRELKPEYCTCLTAIYKTHIATYGKSCAYRISSYFVGHCSTQ